MNRTSAICLTLLILAGLTAVAAGQTYTTTAEGMRTVTISPSKVQAVTLEANEDHEGLKTLFSNLSDYRYATYFCCSGTVIQGPDAQQGGPGATWRALPLTPKTNVTLTKIEAPFFTLSGTASIAVWLAVDSGGIPGDTIAGPIDVDNLPGFFGCCALTTVKFANVPLSKDTPYWLVVGTDANSMDSVDGWAFNTTDMRSHPSAFYATVNGKWLSHSDLLPAIRILGK